MNRSYLYSGCILYENELLITGGSDSKNFSSFDISISDNNQFINSKWIEKNLSGEFLLKLMDI